MTIQTKTVKKRWKELPKCYSEQEKKYIVNRLKEEAAKCLTQYGIKRTTVDELVKRVKIPKGTFYLFYQSKEMLLFEVILEQHDKIEKQLYDALSGLNSKTVSCQQLTDLLFRFYKAAEEMPILKMMNSDEIEILERKLPEDVLARHLAHDNSMVENIFRLLSHKGREELEPFSAAFREIFFVMLHKEEFSQEYYDQGLKLLIKGLVMQLMK